MNGLSPRLAMVATLVGTADTVADIGSDHGLIPIALVRAGRAAHAIAVEVTGGPYDTVREAVRHAGLAHQIDTRLGDGLHPITPGEVDAVVVAGMGAQTMWDILTSTHAQTVWCHAPMRLILQPMGSGALLRWFADAFDFVIAQDVRVRDGGIVYECVSLSRAGSGEQVRNPIEVRTAYDALGIEDRIALSVGLQPLQVQCPLAAAQLAEEYAKRGRMLKELAYPMTDRAYARARSIREECGAILRLYETYYGTSLRV